MRANPGAGDKAEMAMDGLKLVAFDAEDLAIISAHLQGATLTVGDLAFLPLDKRFALVASRVPSAWAMSEAPARGELCQQRRMTGLHFNRVLKVATRGIDRSRPQDRLDIVAIAFTASDRPAGQVTILLTGDRDVRLDVECLEAACSDMGKAAPAGADA